MTATLFDQYYTSPQIAKKCFDIVSEVFDLSAFDYILEPSAGAGAFYDQLPPAKRVGIDIDPRCAGVIQQNFFDFVFEPGRSYFVIGNPPFGRNANLAVKFFNTCANNNAEAIAFILPRTFRKSSIINRLHLYYHRVYDSVLPPLSFVFENQPRDVPCVFQIWERREVKRSKKTIQRSHSDFDFCTKQEADIAIQRVGVRAGMLREKTELQDYSHESHFLIKLLDPAARGIIDLLDFDSVKFNTAGNPSISRSELIELYTEKKTALMTSLPSD